MSEIDDGYIYHIEKIVCPHCGLIQDAKVEHSVPYFTYIHICEECGATITESEWELYKSRAEKLAEEYADKQLAIADKELSESGYSRRTKMGIRLFEGSDIEEAYLQGFCKARMCDKPSPLTGGDMELMEEPCTVKFRGEDVTFTKKYYHCVESGKDFTDTELDNDNMWAIFRAYCEKMGCYSFKDIVLKNGQG